MSGRREQLLQIIRDAEGSATKAEMRAEIARLMAEIEQLRRERDEALARAGDYGKVASEQLRKRRAAEAQVAKLREALENAAGFLDTPISRLRNQGDSFYDETVKSIRSALAALAQKEGQADAAQ